MEAIQYRCPCCASPLVFDGQGQEMTCHSCGNTFPVEGLEEASRVQVENTTDAQMQWEMPQAHSFDQMESDHLRAYHCKTCGAEIVADDVTAATECVYCGNPTILPGVLEGAYRPDGVLPFKTTREQAQAAYRNHCKGKKLLPNGFFDNSRLEKITGVYVPFWLFQCEAEADMTYNATRVSVRREGQYEVTRTSHFLLRRGGHVRFKQVPVDGSSKMDDAMMESIEPFDAEAAKDFTIAYLSGYQAQRHDVGAEECQPRVNERIRNSVRAIMNGTVLGYTTAIPANTQIQMEHGKVKQVLMPVWLLNTRWKDQVFTFAMNGRTGQFIGDLPTDKGKFWKWLLGLFGGISLGGYAVALLLAFMGVL